jgi:oxygen-independent coproporphyrinogen-3 oxidase
MGEQASEALLMGLRLAEGIDLSKLEARFGIPSTDLINADRLALHSDLGLLEYDSGRITVTPSGMPLLDALLGEIVADALVTA